MQIGSVLRKSAVVSMLAVPLVAGGCTKPTTPAVSEIEYEICRTWQSSLPTRSGADTQQTKDEIGNQYDDFLAACEGWVLPF